MPIDSTHPHYSTKKSSVCEDAYNGDVLDYIPRLKGQSHDDYDAYRQRGVFYNVTKRATEAMVGSALRKPFVTDVPDAVVDGHQSLPEFVSNIMRAQLINGRAGILVDFKDGEDTPYLCLYKREHIINWRPDLSMVVLHEDAYVPKDDDPYELEERERFRELFIDELTGNYTVRIWEKSSKGVKSLIDERVPTRRGEPLKEIPFVFVTPFDTTTNEYDPVMINMAQINISHFKTVVDLEHGAHYTALPTPWYSGEFAQEQNGQVFVGGDYFLAFEEGAQVGYLEFTGSGLKALEERRENKEMQMATLGSQMMVKAGIESADAMRIRSSAETATMNNIVTACEAAMQRALSIYKWWTGTGNTEQAQFEMSRDFNASQLSPQEMVALMNLYLNGTISQETYLENLYEGEITQDVEEEMKRLTVQNSSQNA